jgi:hypothetical protein
MDEYETPTPRVIEAQTPHGLVRIETVEFPEPEFDHAGRATVYVNGEEVESVTLGYESLPGWAAREMACYLDDRPLEEKLADEALREREQALYRAQDAAGRRAQSVYDATGSTEAAMAAFAPRPEDFAGEPTLTDETYGQPHDHDGDYRDIPF